MGVFFGGIIQGFGRFRHSPIPTKTHTLIKQPSHRWLEYCHNILYRVGLQG